MFTSQEIVNANLKNATSMIKSNVEDSDKWLMRAILAIFECQTYDEQNSESTKHNNSIGFNGVDAHIMSSFAKQILVWNRHVKAGTNRYNSPLSDKQLRIARRKMTKYAKQLARIVRVRSEIKEVNAV